MARRADNPFTSVRTEGGLLPVDIFQAVADGNTGRLEGLAPSDYHLARGERLNEAISRSWARMTSAWTGFKAARGALPEADPGTTLTRSRWLLPLFQELGYGRLPATKAIEIGGASFPVSHAWQNTPIHLLGFRADLDRKQAGLAGAARSSPHSLVQVLLNRSDDHLWGFVSNGLVLRILRDNVSLSRQAYVEFDLESMMEGELFSDFCLLWLLCHQSRVEAPKASDCWLEKWTRAAADEGRRALDGLRDGVEKAIGVLGHGFLEHSPSHSLLEALRSGALAKDDYYRHLLRVVYRLLFLLVAEDRGLLLDPKAGLEQRKRYERFYSLARLRRLAASRRGSRHVDLWRGLRLVMTALGSDGGGPSLALPPLGGFLFSNDAIGLLATADVSNASLLAALRCIALTEDDGRLRAVDFKNLGAEELGSVYESLLELHPLLDTGTGTFELKSAAGSERKTTGSYYTPTSLIECLLDSALDPVVEAAASKPNPEAALLALKICDPACGSGHFLIAAAHRLSRRIASVRTGEEEPDPASTRTALRDVIGRCLYGVDINPMAAELCRVALWIEALEPGKPLTFLDHHIQVGNSLLGATPALLAKGIPDEAFDPIEGDDRKACSAWKKQNKRERGQMRLSEALAEPWEDARHLSAERASLDAVPDDSLKAVRDKEARWNRLRKSDEYLRARFHADAWCAAFVWKKTSDPDVPPPVTEETFRRVAAGPGSVPRSVRTGVGRLADAYGFFHWHLAFPEVFLVPTSGEGAENEGNGWSGGFDVILGNPPWERVKLEEQEFFAARDPEVAKAPTAVERTRRIADLLDTDPALHKDFLEARRLAEGASQLLRETGRFPLCGRGDVNTYAVFAELARQLIGFKGRAGIIVPSGIATDDTTKFYFQDVVGNRILSSLYDFQASPGLFGEIGHARFKFCLLTLAGPAAAQSEDADFSFFLRSTDEMKDPERHFRLSPQEVKLLNPNTGTCPVFRSRRDAEITKRIYHLVPVLIDESRAGEAGNPWGVSFMSMFHMSNDSGHFRSAKKLESEGWRLRGNVFLRGQERFLPLYEAKMVHHYDHRFGDYGMKAASSESTALPEVPIDRLQDPTYTLLPRYWVPESEVESRLRGRWDHPWLLGWRDICRNTDERTVIGSVIPRVGVGNQFPLMGLNHAGSAAFLNANLASFVLDFAARQKVGGTHLNYFVCNQLPVLPPTAHEARSPWDLAATVADWLHPRVLELLYTARDLVGLAKDLGHDGPPFRWDGARRHHLRCEIDAAFFHLYGIPRPDVDYILDTFPIVRRNDEKKYGDYRTKLVILDLYDRLQRAIDTGKHYQTLLDPPPGDPRCCHPAREI